jgi:hypothetical protein
MENIELPEKRVQVKQLENAESYWYVTDIEASISQRRILIKGKRVSIVDGDRIEIPHDVCVTNYSYRVPVVNAAGQPVMIATTDTEGNTVSVQKTIGEFDLWFKRLFEPAIWPSVQLGVMVDLGLLQSNPITHTEV